MAREFVTEDGSRYESLDDLMETGHVIQVNEDLTITDTLPNERAYWAPEVTWDGSDFQVDGDGWSLMSGYSGQWSYSGPGMHSSEYVGGGLEKDILSTPGLYVTLIPNDSSECDTACKEDCSGEHEYDGWVIAQKEI